MALSKYATPEEVREYQSKRRLAWLGIMLFIAVALVGVVANLVYDAPFAVHFPPVVAGLAGLMFTGWWANNHGVAD